MKERHFIYIASGAALICGAAVFFLMVQINRTRLNLQADGVVEFNFVQQNDHNFDEFAMQLMRWRHDRSIDPDAPRHYLERFDIIWSALAVSDAHWTGSLKDRPETDQFVAESRAFLDRVEPWMQPDYDLSDAQIDTLVDDVTELGRQVYELGLGMYQRKSILRDDISRRMDLLTDAFWFFGGSLVLAGIALFALMTRAYKRASALFEQANTAKLQLATALEELTDGDIERRKQNRFIATASHDLRQPLHALGLNLTTLRGHVNTPLGRRLLDNASRSTEALNQLLNSVLDVSRLDAEIIEVKHRDLALDDVFERLHHTFMPEANERGLAFEVHLCHVAVHSDRVLLERILSNLISNALRYTDRGSVMLDAEEDDDHILISVSDTGQGIPERERAAVFDEYYQMDSPDGTRSQGLGLGLSIVHRLTRLLNVGLEVRSSVGGGTRFELRVERGDAAVLEQAMRNRPADASDIIHFDGLTALVIDDDRDVRDGMHLLLEQRSCRVMTAESAAEARAAIVAEEAIPDVIIADYRLRGDQTGANAIAEVREEVNEDVPALIVTGDTSPARLREASASGFRLLNKPVVPDELFAAIGELTGRRT